MKKRGSAIYCVGSLRTPGSVPAHLAVTEDFDDVDELNTYAPFHLARADMFRRSDQSESALDAYHRALVLTENQVERYFIHRRISELGR